MPDYVVNGQTYTQGADGHYYPQSGAAPSGLDRPAMSYTPLMTTKTDPKAPYELQSSVSGAAKGSNEAVASQYDPAISKEKLREAQLTNRQFVGDPSKHGEAYRASIGPSSWLYNLVPLVARGEVDPKQVIGGGERGNSDAKLLFSSVAQYDPSWTPSVGQARYDTRQDFQSSKGDSNRYLSSVDRAANALRLLKSASDAMAGSNTGYAPFNRWLAEHQQDVGENIGPAKTFDTMMSEAMGQISAVVGNGGGGTDASRAVIQQGATPHASIMERNRAIDALSNAVGNALNNKKAEWDSAFQGSAPIPRWISPQNASFLEQSGNMGKGTLNPYQKQPAPVGSPWIGARPGGGDGGSTTATGPTTTSPYSPETTAGLAGLARSGASVDQANAFLASTSDGKGHQVTPDNWAATQKWLADYKGKTGQDYTGPLSAYKSDHITPAQDAVQTLGLNGSVGAGLANYANSAALGVPAWLAGNQGRANLDQISQDHPVASFLGNAAGLGTGALATGLGLGAAATKLAGSEAVPALARAGASWLAKSPAAAQAASDAISGGIFGSTSDPEHPFIGAAVGAGGGLAGNLIGQAIVSPALRYAAETAPGQAVVNGVSKMVGGGAFTPAAPVSAADAMVARVAKPDIGTIAQKLGDAQTFPGLPYTPADTTPQMGNLLGSATRHNPEVAGTVDRFLTARQANANTRALGSINQNLAPTSTADAIASDVKSRAQAAAEPHYQAAYAEDPVVSASLQKILAKPPVQAALKDASDMATTEGFQPIVTNPDGSTAYPIRTLHYTQQALDDMLQSPKYQNADGTMNNKGRILSGVRADLANETQSLSPNFKTAQNTYSEIAGQGDAAKLGQSFLKGTPTNPLDTAQAISATPPPNIPYLQQGYASEMANRIGLLKPDNANPFSAVNRGDHQETNLGLVFPSGAGRFGLHQGLENDMAGTNYAVNGNSLTAARSASDAQFAPPPSAGSGVAGMAMDAAMMHGGMIPANTMSKIVSGVPRMYQKMTGTLTSPADLASGVAPTLLNPDPAASLAQLRAMIAADQLRQDYLAGSRAVGGAVTGALTAPGAVSALGILSSPSR